MKKLISIGKLAKITNITIETLRYYDKKGILKPEFIDPQTNYRYYSILQYHKLIIILELRELGMSIDYIKDYIENQTVETSLELFKSQQKVIKQKIKKLELIDKNINNKIKILNNFKNINKNINNKIKFEHIGERKIITTQNELEDEEALTYELIKFDSKIENILPTLVPVGFFVKPNDIFDRPILFFLIDNLDDLNIKNNTNITLIKENMHATLYFRGGFEKANAYISDMVLELKDKNYKIIGKIILIPHIEETLTSIESEHLFEIQIPIKIIK